MTLERNVKSSGGLTRVDSIDLTHERQKEAAKLKRVDSLDLARTRLEHCQRERRHRTSLDETANGKSPGTHSESGGSPRQKFPRRASFTQSILGVFTPTIST